MNRKAPARPKVLTHQGGPATPIPKTVQAFRIDAVGKVVPTTIERPLERLRRSVLACLLWEDTFYESGGLIERRIIDAAAQVSLADLALLAVEARTTYNLRSAPMLLLSTLIDRASGEKSSPDNIQVYPGSLSEGRLLPLVATAIEKTVQRADELTELLAIYWRNGKRPLTAQLKKGLARAFTKFDAYQLAKYDRANAIRLRDVLFLTHATPKDEAQAALWKSLVDGTIESPLTWEVELSAGKDKKETFERLLVENKLGYLALLRNLRNMEQAKVDPNLIAEKIVARRGAKRVLPFRYVAAARAVPRYEPLLDQALVASIGDLPALPGKTAVLVDVSGSMDHPLSDKSDLNRIDAAATLASIIPTGQGQLRVFTFSDMLQEVAPRRGMAGIDAVKLSQPHSGTYLAGASKALASQFDYDRLIVITDEQSSDGAAHLRPGAKGYLINVAPYQQGVNYGKGWVHINGFSENVLRFIDAFENAEKNVPAD